MENHLQMYLFLMGYEPIIYTVYSRSSYNYIVTVAMETKNQSSYLCYKLLIIYSTNI